MYAQRIKCKKTAMPVGRLFFTILLREAVAAHGHHAD